MDKVLITVAETGVFLRQAVRPWIDKDRAAFVDYIAANPDAGAVLPDRQPAENPLDPAGHQQARRGAGDRLPP